MKYIFSWGFIIIAHFTYSQAAMKTFVYNSSLWKTAEEIDEIKLKYKAFSVKCIRLKHPFIQSPSMVQGSEAFFRLVDKAENLPAGMGKTLCIRFDKFNHTFMKGGIYLVWFGNDGSLLYIEDL